MQFKLIKKHEFDFYYSLLEKDFCFEERRWKEDELTALKNKNFKPYFIYDKNIHIGYFCCWEFEDFIFWEHFAILEEYRNKGFGTVFLKQFLDGLTKPLVFEIEQPIDEQSKRRKKFYERLNLIFNDYEYYQPSYHKNGNEIPMIFVSYPKALTKREFDRVVKIIKREVYNIQD